MSKFFFFIIFFSVLGLFSVSCSKDDDQDEPNSPNTEKNDNEGGKNDNVVLYPTIDESSIVCDLSKMMVIFNAEKPVGTKIQVLLRQLTNGTEERTLDAISWTATGNKFYVNLINMVGGSDYAFYIIGYDSKGKEVYRSSEHTFSIPKNAAPPAPKVEDIKAYAPSSLVAADGYIEGAVITTEMEYSIDEDQTWTPITENGIIRNLHSGIVLLRIAETLTTNAGESASVVVPSYISNTDLGGDNGTSDGFK